MPSPARIRSTLAALASAPEEVRELRSFYRALADTTRLRLMHRLAAGTATVTELTEHVDLSQPLVSWHLRTLRAAGLIETRRSGREVICSLSREGVRGYLARERRFLACGEDVGAAG